MKKKLVSTLLLSLLMLCSSNLKAAEEGVNYTLTRQYGSVFFNVLHQQYLKLVGRFDDYAGTLYLDVNDMTKSRLSATVNMASLNMADADVVETLVSSSVWFNASFYPEATFTTLSVTPTGEMSADFEGELDFVGITKPWTLHVQFFGGKDNKLEGRTVGMQATGSLNRKDFGLDQYMNMAVETVDIEVNVKFNRD